MMKNATQNAGLFQQNSWNPVQQFRFLLLSSLKQCSINYNSIRAKENLTKQFQEIKTDWKCLSFGKKCKAINRTLLHLFSRRLKLIHLVLKWFYDKTLNLYIITVKIKKLIWFLKFKVVFMVFFSLQCYSTEFYWLCISSNL